MAACAFYLFYNRAERSQQGVLLHRVHANTVLTEQRPTTRQSPAMTTDAGTHGNHFAVAKAGVLQSWRGHGQHGKACIHAIGARKAQRVRLAQPSFNQLR